LSIAERRTHNPRNSQQQQQQQQHEEEEEWLDPQQGSSQKEGGGGGERRRKREGRRKKTRGLAGLSFLSSTSCSRHNFSDSWLAVSGGWLRLINGNKDL